VCVCGEGSSLFPKEKLKHHMPGDYESHPITRKKMLFYSRAKVGSGKENLALNRLDSF
jgi:hypothetical protein